MDIKRKYSHRRKTLSVIAVIFIHTYTISTATFQVNLGWMVAP